MSIEIENLGTPVATLRNAESVVEIYLDLEKRIVIELKQLKYSRYKRSEYPISDYLKKVKGVNGIDQKLMNIIQN